MNERWAAEQPRADQWRGARLVLIRHGESLWNAEQRVQGQLGPGLSALGRQQAETVAARLVDEYPDPVEVFSSDLQRVVETSEPYLSRTGRSASLEKRLREIETGDWSGLLMREVAERFPEQIRAIRDGEDIARGGGETFAALRTRVGEAIREIALRTAGHAALGETATALVFTHGGPVRVAVAEALGLPPNGHRLLDPPDNCSVTVLNAVVGAGGEIEAITLGGYNRHR